MDDFFAFNRKIFRELRPKLPRRIAGACLSMMRYFLVEAQHSKTFYQGMVIERGQIFRGRLKVSEDTGLSERTVRTAIKRLESIGELASKPTSGGTIFTIVKYDLYDASRKKMTSHVARNRPTGDQPVTTCNERELRSKEKEERNQTPISSPVQDPDPTDVPDPVPPMCVEGYGKSDSQESPPEPVLHPEASALARTLEHDLGWFLGTKITDIARLESFRRRAAIAIPGTTDEDLRQWVLEGADWIMSKCRRIPWNGIFGVLEKRLTDGPSETLSQGSGNGRRNRKSDQPVEWDE